MKDHSPVDLTAVRAKRAKLRNDKQLADFALSQCEQALIWHDWPNFEYWFRIYQGMPRRAPPHNGALVQEMPLRPGPIRVHGPKVIRGIGFTEAKEVAIHYAKIGIALLAIMQATPVPAQTVSYSSSPGATAIASTILPTANSPRLYMRVIGGQIIEKNVTGMSTADGIYYQISGAIELSIDDRASIVHAGEGVFIRSGAALTIRPLGDERATYLQFLLSPIAYFDLADLSDGDERELYRSKEPIPELRDGSYALNLTKVILPFQTPPDMLHHRSGAALHLILSGVGAENLNGTTAVRGPGSISYEPANAVYQWSNPGNVPLTYLVFNLNPASEDPVIADAADKY